MLDPIHKILNQFKSISLDEMNDVSLMKRTDTKFVVNIKFIHLILEKLKDHYSVLEIDKRRIMKYSSLYLDTPEFKFYHDHHNGRVNRTKIRQRKYVDSNLTFLEIKQKNGKGETNKSRIKIDDFETLLKKSSDEFIQKITNKKFKLVPSLWNRFNRITLVNLKNKERVTIDLKLSYTINNSEKSYNDLVIVEVKQSRFNRNSIVVKTLKNFKYYPYSISKYCIGVVNIYKDLKHNLFKKKLLRINKITT